ncbi:MAG: proteasome assembly chaperone family protein [Nitrososphaerales archaeon]
MKIQLVVRERPELKDPIVICGLPGSAFVGKFAVDHLIGELSAKPLAEIYSDGFPPQIFVKEDGLVSLMRNDLYYWKNKEGARDLILFTGDSQPTEAESEYLLSENVVDFAMDEHKARELITLGAYVTGAYTENSRVFAAATDVSHAKKIEEMGCSMMNEGGITGMNGLLLGIAKLKGMTGYTLLGETSGYVFDAKASESILTTLGKIIDVRVDPGKLEQRAKEAQEVLNAIDRMRGHQNPQQSPVKKRLDYIS